MKKNCTTKNRIKAEHKKDIFQTHKEQNQNFYNPMNRQHTHIALTNQKSSAVYFKDVKTEETFSSHFLGQKITTAQIRFCNDR